MALKEKDKESTLMDKMLRVSKISIQKISWDQWNISIFQTLENNSDCPNLKMFSSKIKANKTVSITKILIATFINVPS